MCGVSIMRCSDGAVSLRKDPFIATGMHTEATNPTVKMTPTAAPNGGSGQYSIPFILTRVRKLFSFQMPTGHEAVFNVSLQFTRPLHLNIKSYTLEYAECAEREWLYK